MKPKELQLSEDSPILNTTTSKLSVSNLVQYMKGEVVSKEELENINKLLFNFHGNLGSFMVASVYKQMERVSRMLDFLERAEQQLYERALEGGKEVDLSRVMKTTSQNIIYVMQQIMEVSTLINKGRINPPQQLKPNTVPKGFEGASQTDTDDFVLGSESRNRVRAFLDLLGSSEGSTEVLDKGKEINIVAEVKRDET